MRKPFLLILILFSLALFGCTSNEIKIPEIDYDYDDYQVQVLKIGDVVPLNLDNYLSEYAFNKVSFSYDQEIIRVNYLEELIALKSGYSELIVTLYYDDIRIVSLYLGRFYVVDENDPDRILIFDADSLYWRLKENPEGFYILANDIELDGDVSPIEHFNGILINPKGYVIRGLGISENNDAGFIKYASYAYIDGIILEDVKISGGDSNPDNWLFDIGGLVSSAYRCSISNVKVSGEVSNGRFVGGIAGYIRDTYLVNSSFEGTVKNGIKVGGLVGSFEAEFYKKSGKIANSYVNAQLSGGYREESGEKIYASHIGGLVGMLTGAEISNCYVTGSINKEADELVGSIMGSLGYYDTLRFEYIYYTLPYDAVDKTKYSYIDVRKTLSITVEKLKSGKPLEGLDNFQFIPGEFPRLKSE